MNARNYPFRIATNWLDYTSSAERTLALSCLFGALMVIVRVGYTDSSMFLFLIWNLFLAFIPYLITRLLMGFPQWVEKTIRFVPAFLLWLVFIPNSFYILTDLFHLQDREGVPLWFDLALILSFAWNGLLLGIMSVQQMEKIVEVKFGWKNNWLFVLSVMWLNGLGVYIGRYLRFNSWDVLANPFRLVEDVVYLFAHPLQSRFEWSMICCFSLLITLIYSTIKYLGKSIG